MDAWGDAHDPESQVCPVCDQEWHTEDCLFGKEVEQRLKAVDAATKLWVQQQNLAAMLRKCAHALRNRGREDLASDVVGLLRVYDLLGSPLREGQP